MSVKKPVIYFFQRRPRKGFSFSLEYIFEDVRKRLEGKIEAEVKICSYFNDGYFTKFYNILEASIRQGKGINHITGEVHFLNLLMKKNRVLLTILDCGMMYRKKGLARLIIRWLYLSGPVRKARLVTAISEATKQEIIAFTGCSADKIVVVPVAVSPAYQPALKVFCKEKPTILHVGLGHNKNIFRLIDALEGISCRLSIVGKLTPEHKEALNRRNIDYVNSYDLSAEEMVQRYRECDILSYVSTFEGFGMPIVEANCIERVVVTSNLSSMPEVAGDSACLVDPFNTNDIRRGILKVIEDDDYREALIEQGRINRLRFDADTIADSYYQLYCKM